MNSNLKKWMFSILILSSLFSCNHKPEKTETENNSSFYVGTYVGTLPCASCPGIKTIIKLNEDNSFNRSEEYLDEENSSFLETGKYDINYKDSVITLFDSISNQNQMYKCTGSELRHLDINGKEILGSLRENYILKRKVYKKILK